MKENPGGKGTGTQTAHQQDPGGKLGPSFCPSCFVLNCPDPLTASPNGDPGKRREPCRGLGSTRVFPSASQKGRPRLSQAPQELGVVGRETSLPGSLWAPAAVRLQGCAASQGQKRSPRARSCKGARSTVAKVRLGSPMPGFSFLPGDTTVQDLRQAAQALRSGPHASSGQ